MEDTLPVRKITVDQTRTAIEDSYGNMNVIATRLECSERTLGRMLKEHPDLMTAFEAEKGKLVHLAEQVIHARLLAGDAKVAMFVLEHKGKTMGWGKENETVTHQYLDKSNTTINVLNQKVADVVDVILSSDRPFTALQNYKKDTEEADID